MLQDMTIGEFTDRLSSKAPVPGGGGASALAGSLACSLSEMVIQLTLGKKKYAAYEEELRNELQVLSGFRAQFLRLAEKDEEVFLPLSRAYGLPKNTEEERAVKERVLEQALYDASLVPLSILETARAAAESLLRVSLHGSRLAISDAGVSACYLRTAASGAAYNVSINTKLMKNAEKSARLDLKKDKLLQEILEMADRAETVVKERM